MSLPLTRVHLAVAAITSALALVVAPAARAQPPTAAPPGNSAVSQYLETIPTASGNVPTRGVHNSHHGTGAFAGGSGGGSGGSGSAVPSSTASSLAASGSLGRTDAKIAEATAPQTVGHHVGSQAKRGSDASAAPGSTPPAASSISSALTGSSSGGGLGVVLPVLLALLFVGGSGLAVLRRRARRQPPTG